MFVYLIKNKINEKCYVGITTRRVEQRLGEHVYHAKQKLHNMSIHSAIRKHGIDSFDVSVLQECNNIDELNKAEKFWILKLDSFKSGYNSTHGGEGLLGHKHSEETKQKMSESRKGEKSWAFGKKLSEETKQKISISQKKLDLSNRVYARGWHHTDLAKQKIGESTSIRKRKQVTQFSKTGQELQTFISLQEAAKNVCGDANVRSSSNKISEVLCGHRRTHKGFVWKYTIINLEGN